jgi:hypothetical protein
VEELMIMAEDIEYLQLKLMDRIRSSEIVGPGYMKTSVAAAATSELVVDTGLNGEGVS